MTFHWYGFFLGLGIVAGTTAAEWLIRKFPHQFHGNEQSFSRFVVWVVIGGLVGARMYHLRTDWTYYAPLGWQSWFAVWNGGLGIWGAMIGGVAAALVFFYLNQFSRKHVLAHLDLIGFGLPLGQTIGRWGNFANMELFGKETTLPWGMHTNQSLLKYHPLFAYESFALFFFWIACVVLIKKQKILPGKGVIFFSILVFYGVLRFFLEFLRVDPAMLGLFAIAQWLALLSCGIGCAGFVMLHHVQSHQRHG